MSALTVTATTSIVGRTIGDVIERYVLALPSVDAPVLHHFAPGLYIREVRMVPGLAVGHRHKLEHLNVLLEGHLTLIDEHTGAERELRAPFRYVAQPGRKIAVVHAPTCWWNVIATTETDVDVLESMMLDKSEAWQTSALARAAVDSVMRQPDRDDFARFLTEAGLTADYVRGVSESESDQAPMPLGWPKFTVRPSPIEGRGVFVSAPVLAGEVIAPARVGMLRTPAGRFTNHSGSPNAAFVRSVDGDIYLVATRPIRGCVGGDQGEEVTVDYRQALAVNRGEAP
jgi:hypothetical protein